MNSNIDKIYIKKQNSIKKLNHPRILINICSHGNEILGLKVKKLFKNVKILNGSLTFNIGNNEALFKKVRFIDADLNRSFPGKKMGNKEEKIAFNLMKYIPQFDYLIDIHSTVSGLKNSIIIEDFSKKNQKLISVCNNAQTVLYMSATSGVSIFRACKTESKNIPGIAFEYGNNSMSTAQRTFEDVINILNLLKVTKFNIKKRDKKIKPKVYKCFGVISKNKGDVLVKNLKNFKLIKKNDTIFIRNNKEILSKENFYPILLGEKNYKDIFGFKGKLI